MRPRKCPIHIRAHLPPHATRAVLPGPARAVPGGPAMPQRQRVVLALLVTPLIALIAVAALHRPAEAKRARGATLQCPTDCGVMLDHAPWVCVGDRPMIAVCIRAGQVRLSFTQDGTNGCITVTGLGTT